MGRVDRLQDQIKKVVSVIVQKKLNDPQIGFTTITDVELTRDLQLARVFYSVYGDDKVRQQTAKALRKARGFILRELAREIRIKKLPEVEFHPDDSVSRGLRVQELLDQIESESDQRKRNSETDS
jgi:ribosome-binding factor A